MAQDQAAAGGAEPKVSGSGETRESPAAAPWPSLPVRGLQLAALWSIAVVWPLFDVLRNEPDFFVARGNTAGDIILYALIHVFLPPLVMVGIEALVDLASRRAGRIVHLAFIAALVAIFALQFTKNLLPTLTSASILLALAIGVLLALLYARQAAVRSVLTWLSPAPLVVLILFLFLSPISDILFPAEGQARVVDDKGNGTPVFLIVFDEAPAAALMNRSELVNSARFPNFGALARTSTWYRNNTTVADGTAAGVPAILSGQRPADRLSPTRTYPQSVYTLLGSGYDITNVEPVTRVCPRTICPVRVRSQKADAGGSRLLTLINDLTVVERKVLYPPELADRLPAVDTNFEDFGGEIDFSVKPGQYPEGRIARFGDNEPIAGESKANQILARSAKLAGTIDQPRSKPPLFVLHLEIPHPAWRFEKTGAQYQIAENKIPGLTDKTWGQNQYLVDVGLQRFLLQTQYADSILGSLVSDIKASGLWQKSLVIVTTDHGATFQTGMVRRSIEPTNFAEMANTPLFVKYPGQKEGKISDSATRSIDILPTIARETGIESGWKYEGRPLDSKFPEKEVTVRNAQEQGPVSHPFEKMLAERRVIVDRWTRLFPGGDESLYRLGPNQELIGKEAAPLETAAGKAKAEIANRSLYEDIRPESGVLPFNVAGRLSGLGSGRPLAVAVNGKVAAVGESYNTPDGIRFGILVPPKTMTGSRKAKVTVYQVTDGRLRPLGSAGG
ncbi:MAG: sulfatase-like hydrolase/transferase [Solirubrobacterales bacterium]